MSCFVSFYFVCLPVCLSVCLIICLFGWLVGWFVVVVVGGGAVVAVEVFASLPPKGM